MVTYPTIEATNTSASASGTSHTVNLPSGIEEGDLLIIVFRTGGAGTTHSLSGWSQQTVVGTGQFSVFWKIATGGEGGTIIVTTTAARLSAHITYRISGVDESNPITFSNFVTSLNVGAFTVDFDPVWNAANVLWILTGTSRRTDNAFTAPASYGGQLNSVSTIESSSTNDVRLATCHKLMIGNREDPDAWGSSGTTNTLRSIAFAVNPSSPPLVDTDRTHKRVDTFNVSGNWKVPPDVTSVDVEVWGAGGGGTSGGTAGGGGAYSRKNNISVTPGDEIPIVVGVSAMDTNGGDSSFDTNVVLAKGGFRGNSVEGANQGLGGQATGGIGDVKYSGGNASNSGERGGGGAGSQGAGTDMVGGLFEGGRGGTNSFTTNVVSNIAGGGGALNTNDTNRVGSGGEVRISYEINPLRGFPSIKDFAYGVNYTAGTSHSITIPETVEVGDVLLLVFATRGSSVAGMTTPPDGWSLVTEEANSSGVFMMAIMYRVATGSDSVSIATDASVFSSHITYVLENAGVPIVGTIASSTSGSPNPPNYDTEEDPNSYMWMTPSIAGNPKSRLDLLPIGYVGRHGLSWMRGSNEIGLVLDNSYAFRFNSVEDPLAYSYSGGNWLAGTIGIPYAESGGTEDEDDISVKLTGSDSELIDTNFSLKGHAEESNDIGFTLGSYDSTANDIGFKTKGSDTASTNIGFSLKGSEEVLTEANFSLKGWDYESTDIGFTLLSQGSETTNLGFKLTGFETASDSVGFTLLASEDEGTTIGFALRGWSTNSDEVDFHLIGYDTSSVDTGFKVLTPDTFGIDTGFGLIGHEQDSTEIGFSIKGLETVSTEIGFRALATGVEVSDIGFTLDSYGRESVDSGFTLTGSDSEDNELGFRLIGGDEAIQDTGFGLSGKDSSEDDIGFKVIGPIRIIHITKLRSSPRVKGIGSSPTLKGINSTPTVRRISTTQA